MQMEELQSGTTEPIAAAASETKPARNIKKTVLWVVVLLIATAGIGIAVFYYIDDANTWIRTNNAFVDGKIYRITAQIPAKVERIHVFEGDRVEEGATLVGLAPNLNTLGISREDMRVNYEAAELLFMQTEIRSPAAGYAASLQVDAGEHVLPGQTLMSIVNLSNLWIEANFSEEHIRHVRVGQLAEVTIDAYPEKILTGRVVNILPAGGSVFSLFPPDATAGNWVRVAQRIPVKIVLDPSEAHSDLQLRIGMLARVRVKR